jgi:hypothetical protein
MQLLISDELSQQLSNMSTPKMNQSLSDIFDIELTQTDKPLTEIKAEAQVKEIDSLEKQREYVKGNLIKLIERGMNSLADLNTIANASEKSRDFEVMAGLIKTLVDTNIELLNVEVAHKPKLNIESTSKQEASTINNNTVFVGSTKELASFLTASAKNSANVIEN